MMRDSPIRLQAEYFALCTLVELRNNEIAELREKLKQTEKKLTLTGSENDWLRSIIRKAEMKYGPDSLFHVNRNR